MSTIFSTRNGFLYQDRFAVLTYLTQFQAKDVKAFYVDFALPSQKSMDIKLLTISDVEKVYEVKTGENFKTDKRKKDSSEVRDAFINLHEYKRLYPNVIMSFIVNPKFQGQITEYWHNLTQINASPSFLSPSAKRASNWLHQRLRIPNIARSSDFYVFCKGISIDCSSDDRKQNDDDRYPAIDDDIIQKIDDLANLFRAAACKYELPSEYLLFQMIHECRRLAGTNTNLAPILEELIISFLTHRRLIESYGRPTSVGDRRQEEYQKVLGEVTSWKGGSSSVPSRPVVISEITESS